METTSFFILWNTVFFTLAIFCAIVAFAQWRVSKDSAILWYIGYLLSSIGHYLWQALKDWRGIGPHYATGIEWDFALSYSSTVCYLFFLWLVFDMKNTSPKSSRFLLWITWFYAAMLVGNILLQVFTDYKTMVYVHNIVRTLFFPAMIWFVWYFWSQGGQLFYKRLMLVGTLAVLGGVLSAILSIGSHPAGVSGVRDFIQVFHTKWGTVYWYDMKVGILIDVLCFSWAITLRQKRTLQGMVPTPLPTTQYFLPMVIPKEDEFLAGVEALLSKNFQDVNLTVKHVADAVYKTQDATNKTLKKKTGMTTEQFILRYRLDKAMELLLASDERVQQIAENVGFKDAGHFNHAFKKHFGHSPSDMRRIAQEEAIQGKNA